jgi:NADH-quinone oxidoreductase subunit M
VIAAATLALPILAALLLLAARGALLRAVALLAAMGTFVAVTLLQGSEGIVVPWMPGLGISFALDASGAGGFLALVASLVMVPTVLWATVRVQVRPGHFLAALFTMWAGLLGLFLARDLVLFYVFWEITLLPSLVMLAGWGGRQARAAMLKYLLYAVAGSFAMLITVLAIRPLSGAASYLFSDLVAVTAALDSVAQIWLFVGFVLAFAVKLPIFPVHHWLIDFHEQNHPSGVADAAGTLYKVGGFGLFAWALPLLPIGAAVVGPYLLVVAAFTAVYAAVIATRQTNLKRLLAYASLSHMGLVAVGLFGLHLAGLSGAMFLLAAQMVTTGGLFLLSGMLHARRQTFDLTAYGGLAASAPALAGVTLLVLFASIGVPGLANFPGEFLALLGAFQANPAAGVLAVGAVIAAGVYGVNVYGRLFQGPEPTPVRDLRPLEVAVLAPIVLATLWLGLFPARPLSVFEADAAVVVAQSTLAADPTVPGLVTARDPQARRGAPR